jgi:endonuclease/exonuclease/phosphatase family metal-dependent hydrolase
MAEVLKPFDVVAIQEVADDLRHFWRLAEILGDKWDYLYTDIAGNQERLGYFFRTERVEPTGLAAELAMRGYERNRIIIEDVVETGFEGFNRNPYMVAFKAGNFEFTLVNVHLYWSNMCLRRLEAKALAKWASSRVKKAYPPNDDIILVGDFNMPKFSQDDEIYAELHAKGLKIPSHRTQFVGTNLAGDADYDEIVFCPKRTAEDFTGKMGVVDFDTALCPDLYQQDRTHFYQYMRYYVADHRPMWAEFSR